MTSTNYCMKIKTQLQVVSNQYYTDRRSLWSRDELICDISLTAIERENKLINYKKTVMETNNRSTNRLTKNQQYARLAKGFTLDGNPRVTYATQTETSTNPNINNLTNTSISSYYYCTGIPPGYTGFFGSEYIVNIIGELLSTDYVTHIPTSELKKVIIGYNVTSIGTNAFYDCSNLTDISFDYISNSSIVTIGDNAFYNSGLTSITIQKTVTTIGQSAFQNCSNLQTITFETPSSITAIGGSAFANITSTPTFNLCFNDITLINQFITISGSFENTCSNVPAQTTHFKLLGNSQALIDISDDLIVTDFSNATYSISKANISSVDIGTNVTSIGVSAFHGCSNLTSITIPKTVTTIGYYAFQNCSDLVSITFDDIANSSLITIGDSAFKSSTLTSITIPKTVTTIGYYAFQNCSDLVSITFDDIANSSLITIFESTFDQSGLTSITIPKTVTTIGFWAFHNCSDLTSVIIMPDSSLNSIDPNAFESCTNLKAITIPKTLTTIGDYAFFNCTDLASITFDDIANSSLVTIYENAFYNSAVTSITIPKTVTTIGQSAFQNCSDLSSVIIMQDSSLNSIGVSCFKNTNLITLTYENINYYDYLSFAAVFGTGNIGTDAFLGTPFISTIYFHFPVGTDISAGADHISPYVKLYAFSELGGTSLKNNYQPISNPISNPYTENMEWAQGEIAFHDISNTMPTSFTSFSLAINNGFVSSDPWVNCEFQLIAVNNIPIDFIGYDLSNGFSNYPLVLHLTHPSESHIYYNIKLVYWEPDQFNVDYLNEPWYPDPSHNQAGSGAFAYMRVGPIIYP